MDLIFFGVHQDRAALSTQEIGGVVACIEYWRRADKFSRRRGYCLQADAQVRGHDSLTVAAVE
jgi:hypothetical protein